MFVFILLVLEIKKIYYGYKSFVRCVTCGGGILCMREIGVRGRRREAEEGEREYEFFLQDVVWLFIFHFEWAFLSANTFKFHEVQFIFIFFDLWFSLLPINSLLTAVYENIIILSLRGFRILAFTFGLIIHIKFILKYDVK